MSFYANTLYFLFVVIKDQIHLVKRVGEQAQFEWNPSEVVADPFIDAKSSQRKDDVRTVLKMHADMLDLYVPNDGESTAQNVSS
ncbi:hypothetical protein Tcan_08397 [Toxocara canis]|uniref:Uncharacterized protein n=1 Tax=Toxocara canis TaxID=6265 RepID=A0A0B2VST9_TOXCA|nr:hypothetical protein Tcan_08397 [Toxocara canis]